jgi:hypothetical protein
MSTTDSVPGLKPNQLLALVVLMAEAREVTNNELREIAGFTLTGSENRRLEELGLVETDRSGKPFSHQLTEQGWGLVRRLHTTTPPKSGGSAVRSLFTLLGNVHRSLDRLRLSHGDFFKHTAEVPAEETSTAATGSDVEAQIRAAYQELPKAPGGWVGLADLREHLSGLDRAAVDQALRVLVRREGVRIIPVANSRALKPRDREAALLIGDEYNHALWIGPA